ncbi:MAG: glycosyltransferase family 92 protein, partial [Synergistaceae bacterium]|nr:glycosyltransferase family 92 protein [Synergistaceae bacterium]
MYETKYLILDIPVERYEYFIKYIEVMFKTPYYMLLMKIFRPKNITRKKYYVSICAIFKDEGCYLKEWIEFHKIAGIEHFYLYNNFSSDNYLDVLAPYIKSGEVTLIDWPVPQGQMSAYQDCFKRFKYETNWLAFIDIDEFIIPNKTDTIGEFLKSFEYRPAVLIYWRYFGSSGLIDRDINGLLTYSPCLKAGDSGLNESCLPKQVLRVLLQWPMPQPLIYFLPHSH